MVVRKPKCWGNGLVVNMTDAHKQAMNIHLMVSVPEHAPRKEDPHYKSFNKAKARIKIGRAHV